MRLRFRLLQLRAETARGRFGADIPLADGLMVLRADNSRGKSTSVHSLLYGLGLERMITSKPTQAVPSAMRDRLIYDAETKSETAVLASWVSLEIEGHAGQSATVTRWVKHDEFDSGLVRVVHGPNLSRPGDYDTEDFYVGRAGAVSNPRGFHRWLASFIGWEMPDLPAGEGRIAPLYMEQVFPLLFVEQRRGWGGVQAQMPMFSGVSDVRRRSIEFLLSLDVGGLEVERQRLIAAEAELQEAWRTSVHAFNDALIGQGLVTVRLPEKLTISWPPPQPPTVAESQGSQWVPIDEQLARLRTEHDNLDARGIPSADTDAEAAEGRLSEALEQIISLRQTSALMREDMLRDREELRSVQERLAALRDDLREHQDIVTLQRLGSPELDQLHGDCPVCHQELPTSLLDAGATVRTLSPEDTVSYIKQQIELFEVMERDGDRALKAKAERLSAVRARSVELRAHVRALRTTLTSNGDAPSAEAIAQRIRVQDRIVALERVREGFASLLGELGRLAEEGRKVRASLGDLPRDRLSDADKAKLSLLEERFIEQLHTYDFGSFSDERLNISLHDYLPRREDFDLQADISASDSIRVVWAYLLGLLEVAAEEPTNHPGLVVFDEPRQQSTKDVSFAALLKRAATASQGRQVLFATSEDLGSLRVMLSDLPHTLHAVDGYVLQPINE